MSFSPAGEGDNSAALLQISAEFEGSRFDAWQREVRWEGWEKKTKGERGRPLPSEINFWLRPWSVAYITGECLCVCLTGRF